MVHIDIYEGRRGKKNEPRCPCATWAPKKAPTRLFFFFFGFFEIILLRFGVFLGMRNPETAKKLFCKFFGHGPKSHLMTQKIFFFRYLFYTFLAILRPLQPP